MCIKELQKNLCTVKYKGIQMLPFIKSYMGLSFYIHKSKFYRNTELLNYIKTLSGLRELPVEDPDSIRLEFIPEGEEDASLNLTMHFAVDHSGRVHLKGAEVH